MQKNLIHQSTAAQFLPYVIHSKTGHVCTVTQSGWNTTETEHLHNVLILLEEVKRRRVVKGITSVAMCTSDNYVCHHNLLAVKDELTHNNVLTPRLVENSTSQIQWCDTDLNACLKSKQKQFQSEQLYDNILSNTSIKLDLLDVPEDPVAIRTMDVIDGGSIEMPQVTRGQAHYNSLLSFSQLSYTSNGDGFYRDGHCPNDKGEWLRYFQLDVKTKKVKSKNAPPKNKRAQVKYFMTIALAS